MQSYISYQQEQEKFEKEIQAYEHELDMLREQENDARLAAQYLDDLEEMASAVGDFGQGPISKWKQVAWEPACDAVEEEGEDEEEEEEESHQLAQINVNGIFRYELFWLPESSEVRVVIDQDRKGDPVYHWYPDTMTVSKSLANLMECEESELKIEGLSIFGAGRAGVEAEALPYEVDCFITKGTWRDYASEKYAVQFNINTHKEKLGTCGHAEDDMACSPYTCGRRMTQSAFIRRLEEVWRKNHPTRHGLDGTQCDCEMCERANEMPADIEPYHESVDDERLPTVYECLKLPKRILDALIRNWVAGQPDEDKACAEAAELISTVRKIAEKM